MPPPQNLKRKRFNQPEEINFDFSARQDYLTGFHKRKLERTKHAQDLAAKKEKEAKLEMRRQIRTERKAELERYVKSVDDLMHKAEETWEGGSDSEDEDNEWTGIEEIKPVDYQTDYSDDDRNITVVVEEVDVTREGFRKAQEQEDEEQRLHQEDERPSEPDQSTGKAAKKRKWTRDAPKKDRHKKKKFRYETKAERKMTRTKERSGAAKARAKRKG